MQLTMVPLGEGGLDGAQELPGGGEVLGLPRAAPWDRGPR